MVSKKKEAPSLPLEELKPEEKSPGHGATVIDPRRKHRADKRKKHGR